MSTVSKLSRVAAAAGVTTLAALTIGPAPAGAETTETQTATVELGDLDLGGSAAFEQFDPSLGTLTAVTISADVTMDFDVCINNGSAEAEAVIPAGEVSGDAPITFAGGVIANAAGSMAVPGVTLDANPDQSDACQAWLDTGATPGGDSVLFSESDVSNFSETITDPAVLDHYIGTGTVAFTWTADSDSSIFQPSEWTIIFLASGDGTASIAYEYAPAGTVVTTTTTAPTSATTEPEGRVLGTSRRAPTNLTGATPAPLPRTGNDVMEMVILGAGLVAAGTVLVAVRRRAAHR